MCPLFTILVPILTYEKQKFNEKDTPSALVFFEYIIFLLSNINNHDVLIPN